jgi:ubiquinone/menaquinone biosynthesis methyltransferase
MTGRFLLKAKDHLGTPEQKRAYNELHFAEAASWYDLATRALSLGQDRAWKRNLLASLPGKPSPYCLDLACGTGDVAFLLAERYPRGTVVALDISTPMLDIARGRNHYGNIRFERGDLCALPLPDEVADIVTGSYALRNAPELRAAVAEVRRVLKPGGVAAILDFSKPADPFLQKFQYILLRGWCGLWGLLLHGTPEIHGYIAESLKGFPNRPRLLDLLRGEGLTVISSRRFFLGMTEILLLRRFTLLEEGGNHAAPYDQSESFRRDHKDWSVGDPVPPHGR